MFVLIEIFKSWLDEITTTNVSVVAVGDSYKSLKQYCRNNELIGYETDYSSLTYNINKIPYIIDGKEVL